LENADRLYIFVFVTSAAEQPLHCMLILYCAFLQSLMTDGRVEPKTDAVVTDLASHPGRDTTIHMTIMNIIVPLHMPEVYIY